MSEIRLYAEYGETGSSARVRLYEWDRWLNLGAKKFTYRSRGSNSPFAEITGMRSAALSSWSFARAEWVVRRNSHADSGLAESTVLVSRCASPFSSGGLERRLLQKSRYSVYDFDDAVMMPRDDALRLIVNKPRLWRKALGAADAIVAGNEYLADIASTVHKNVHVVPSCVNPEDYSVKLIDETDRLPKLVWIGSPATEKYLSTVAAPLERLYAEFGARIVVISSGNRAIPGIRPDIVERVSWDRNTFATNLHRGDVGIMPLKDDKWERGKCAYKLLQYGAAGLPIVGSPVGANREVLSALSGSAATDERSWYKS